MTALLASLALLAASATAIGAAASAQSAAPRVDDVDADLLAGGRLRLEAETIRATRVTFAYGDRRVAGRLVEIDDDDGSRDWARTIAPRRADRPGRRVAVRVIACAGSRCTTRTSRETLDRDD